MPLLGFLLRVSADAASQGHVPGEVHVVMPDDYAPTEEEMRRIGWVRVPGKMEELIATYLHDGVPDDVLAAADAETARFRAASVAYNPDRDFLVAKPVLDTSITLAARPGLWPPRMVILDLAQLDGTKIDAVHACWDAYDACRPRADEAIGLDTTERHVALGARADTAVAEDALAIVALNDAQQDASKSRARIAGNAVEAAALASVPIPGFHALSVDELAKATVVVPSGK